MTCECSDPKCPECGGNCNHTATEILYRVDMDDSNGTGFCDQCSADAMHSGLFTDESEEYDEGLSEECSDGLHSQCRDIDANCCECDCHLGLK